MAKIKLEFESFLFRYLIKHYLTPKNPEYAYDTEKGGYNPAFQNISDDSFHCPLQVDEKRIFALRSDFILATGSKNYGKCSFHKPFSMFSDDLHQYLDSKDRYGHPSLAVPHDEYNGSAYYAGWLAQREGYLQIYLYSGRFHRTFTLDECTLVETYLTKQFINAYGEQPIRFYDPEDSEDSDEFTKFLKNDHLETLFREYDIKAYNDLLKSIPIKEKHYRAFLSTQPDGTKLSKTLTKLPHSLIKIAGSVCPLGKTLGEGIFGKTKLSDKNFAIKIEKTTDETQEHIILNDLKQLKGFVARTDKDKTYTQLNYLKSTLHQLLTPYNLKLCSRKPANSKILPHFFYLYLEADEIKYTYQNESNNILDKKLKAADISKDNYEHLKQKLKSPSMQFFSRNTANKDFPYTLWEFEPKYTQIPKNRVSIYINDEGKLCAAFRSKDKQIKTLVFDTNAFELKPKDYRYAICKDRPTTCEKEKTFYLYLNDGGLRCLYRDKNQEEQRWVIEEKSNFYKLLQQVFDRENHKPRIISYYNETLQISLNKASGLVLNELDNNSRIDLAIDLCLEVAALHEGLKSVSKKGYAHRDLKPHNIMIDSKGVVHLIDYGFSKPNPDEISNPKTRPYGTPRYLPDYTKYPNGLSYEQYDIIALKRVLYLPLTFFSLHGKTTVSEFEQKTQSLLSEALLNTFELKSFVNTETIKQCETPISARTLAAVFILTKLGIPPKIYEAELLKNIDLCKKITDIYTRGPLQPNQKKELITRAFSQASTDSVEEESASFGEELEILNSEDETIPKNHPLPTKQLLDKKEPHETEVQALNAQIKALQNTILLQNKQLQEEKEKHDKETNKLKVHIENLQNGQSEHRKEFKKLQNLNHILFEDKVKLVAKIEDDESKISRLEQQAQELITSNNTLNQRVNELLDTNLTTNYTYSKRYHFYEDKPSESEGLSPKFNAPKGDDFKNEIKNTSVTEELNLTSINIKNPSSS